MTSVRLPAASAGRFSCALRCKAAFALHSRPCAPVFKFRSEQRGWWFGRKSALADVRPLVPAWLQNGAAEEGFARSVEGTSLYVKTSAVWANYRTGDWDRARRLAGSRSSEAGRLRWLRRRAVRQSMSRHGRRSIRFLRRFSSTALSRHDGRWEHHCF